MMVLAEVSDLSGVMIMLGAIVVAFTLGRLLGRRGRAPGAPDGSSAEEQIERIEEAGGRVLRDIESLGNETVARAETRLRVLNEMVLRAERAGVASESENGGELAGRFDEVYRLADEGVDPNGIAERTSFERGEVDLILGLRARSRSVRGAREKGGAP